MISQILIRNFQSHKYTVLDLHEGVNVLVGLTGAGKSVVFKALDWLKRNQPLGDEYRSWWGGDTQVEITVKDTGQKVGRIKTDSDNYYYIDDQEFRAFGKGPPPQPVLDLLNFSEANFQAQADPAFLISNSSGEVARYLNKAAHLDVIDQALANVASVLRGEKEDLARTRGDLKEAQEKLIEYDWLPAADEKLGELEELQSQGVHLRILRAGLAVVIDEYGRAESGLAGLKNVLGFAVEVERLILLDRRVEIQNDEWERLAAVVDDYEKAQKELAGLVLIEGLGLEAGRLLGLSRRAEEGREEYERLFGLIRDHERAGVALTAYAWIPKAEGKWAALDGLKVGALAAKTKREALTNIVSGIDEATKNLNVVEADRARLKAEFDRLMPNVCPLCEQGIKKGGQAHE